MGGVDLSAAVKIGINSILPTTFVVRYSSAQAWPTASPLWWAAAIGVVASPVPAGPEGLPQSFHLLIFSPVVLGSTNVASFLCLWAFSCPSGVRGLGLDCLSFQGRISVNGY